MLSYTQKYYLCSINSKGNVSMLNAEYITACLIVSGLVELMDNGYIKFDPNSKKQDKVIVCKPWDNALPYLAPIYYTLDGYKKPKDMKGIAECYVFGGFIRNKPRQEMIEAVGASLADIGDADVLRGKRQIKYAPKREAILRVINNLRSEMFGDGEISLNSICLGTMLDKSGLLRKYFSRFEYPEVKKRLKELREDESAAAIREAVQHIDDIITLITVTISAAATAAAASAR